MCSGQASKCGIFFLVLINNLVEERVFHLFNFNWLPSHYFLLWLRPDRERSHYTLQNYGARFYATAPSSVMEILWMADSNSRLYSTVASHSARRQSIVLSLQRQGWSCGRASRMYRFS